MQKSLSFSRYPGTGLLSSIYIRISIEDVDSTLTFGCILVFRLARSSSSWPIVSVAHKFSITDAPFQIIIPIPFWRQH